MNADTEANGRQLQMSETLSVKIALEAKGVPEVIYAVIVTRTVVVVGQF